MTQRKSRKRGLPPPTRMGRGIKRPGQRKNAKSSINKVRDILYSTNKVLGDAQALSTGKVADRLERRFTGNISSRLLGSNLLKFFQR